MTVTIPKNDDPLGLVVERDYYHARAYVTSQGTVKVRHSMAKRTSDVYRDFDQGFSNGFLSPNDTFAIFTIDCTPPETRVVWASRRGNYPNIMEVTNQLARDIFEANNNEDNNGDCDDAQ